MKGAILIGLLSLAVGGACQAPSRPPVPGDIRVPEQPKVAPAPPTPSSASARATPASDSLLSTAKEMAETRKALDNAIQQAKSGYDANQKTLIDAMTARQKALSDDLKQDKKYSARIKEIETIQQQLKDSQQKAQDSFQASAGPMQQKIATDNALIQGLIPIVKKENGWDDSMTFDVDTQAWKGGK